MAPRFTIARIDAFERMMPFAHPFRFGAVAVEAAAQAFVRAVIDLPGVGRVKGASAEMMMPKWFDKDPAKSPARTIDDLRASLLAAAGHFTGRGEADTAFGHHAAALARQTQWADGEGIARLAGNFGVALIDKAVLDALLSSLGIGLAEGLRTNAPGLDARLTPDLDAAEIADFLAGLTPSGEVALRHTVGLADAIEGPGSLAEEIAAAPLRYFKIKIGGDVTGDLARLRAIAALLDARVPDYAASLDANEQYDPPRLALLAATLQDDPALARFFSRLIHIEQPYDRRTTFEMPLDAAAIGVPVIIDEAEDSYDAFPRAVARGYRGVSSKSCKGLYKAVLNAARVARLNRRHGGGYLLTGEDLTCQPGLGVQQDTALVAALGLTHVERNGHHYVAGFGPAPEHEAQAFARAFPELYRVEAGKVRLDTRTATLPAARLVAGPGFAGGAAPDWAALTPLTTTFASQEIFA
ncbi:L-alanine-DL-glutamate epimerase-like enolase superfamily enzyme [Ancylobacter sp. 3268]|uniref:enolase C-terminal domain-like protein n=1 Tax=Ancylobacter sp. 3268 TaxID=2817752 RepID=UPI002861D8D2|nr:enolase C-terminal domain-like protein [Ancylobacter sp. 3268]MDR6951391.1 L-alanine-DL-glutamate epimerase-like enolase superfamily enzyme [Ancylobacter sp. 3268]